MKISYNLRNNLTYLYKYQIYTILFISAALYITSLGTIEGDKQLQGYRTKGQALGNFLSRF